MAENVFDYKRKEIDEALSGHPEEQNLRLKIMGASVSTKWLSVTPRQVRAIRELLGGGSPDEVRDVLRGEI
jgi:hypothetical protein